MADLRNWIIGWVGHIGETPRPSLCIDRVLLLTMERSLILLPEDANLLMIKERSIVLMTMEESNMLNTMDRSNVTCIQN
jgi:hypothetical protein